MRRREMFKKLLTNWSFVAGDFVDENPMFFARKPMSGNVIGFGVEEDR
jgi:hypothetical protein